MDDWYQAAPPEHQKREKAKARELRLSSWWKQQLGRGLCYYCEQRFAPTELTMDHVIPVGRGGMSNKKNCVPCCKACNSKKGAKTTAEIAMEELGRRNSGRSESD